MSYQKVVLVGNLGNDPSMRYLPNGKPVTNFNLATNRSYTKDDVKVTEVTWFRVSAWGRQAETCNDYLHQGSKVLVEGRLNPDENGNPRIYQRQDGTHGASYELTADWVVFMDSRVERQESAEDGFHSAVEHMDEDDIPF